MSHCGGWATNLDGFQTDLDRRLADDKVGGSDVLVALPLRRGVYMLVVVLLVGISG